LIDAMRGLPPVFMHQKEQEEAMMMRSLAIAALVIGLAGPAVAEQKSTADQKTRQEIEAFHEQMGRRL
jgi:hypothetical protein